MPATLWALVPFMSGEDIAMSGDQSAWAALQAHLVEPLHLGCPHSDRQVAYAVYKLKVHSSMRDDAFNALCKSICSILSEGNRVLGVTCTSARKPLCVCPLFCSTRRAAHTHLPPARDVQVRCLWQQRRGLVHRHTSARPDTRRSVQHVHVFAGLCTS